MTETSNRGLRKRPTGVYMRGYSQPRMSMLGMCTITDRVTSNFKMMLGLQTEICLLKAKIFAIMMLMTN